ncbi:MAG: beta-lactamase family protein [Anaerolineales bacterium]|nr:beta-lactamase family protein [Anaerolineales bacterium]
MTTIYPPETVGFDGERLAQVDRVAQRYVDEGMIAGAVTLVARNGRLVHLNAIGQQDVASQTPMQTDTLFRIYSMTKPITSVAVMMLWEQGKIRLTDPITRFLPQFEEAMVYAGRGFYTDLERQPTIQDLLRHTSGLSYADFENPPFDDEFPKSDLMFSERDLSLAEFMDELAMLPYVYQPGTQWRYSLATDVLGRIVEVASGQTLADFFHSRIFAPLGMHDTFFHVPAAKRDRLATLYMATEQHPMILAPARISDRFFNGRFYGGGGGLVSTASDYLQFAELVRQKGSHNGVRLLGRKTVEYMTQNHLHPDLLPMVLGEPMPGFGFGLGFSVVLDPAQTAVVNSVGNHGWGGWASTNFWVDPQEQLIGMVMTQLIPNGTFTLSGDFRTAVYQALVD